MSVNISCPKCSKSLKVPDSKLGRIIKCPACDTKLQVGQSQPRSSVPSQPPPKPPAPPAVPQLLNFDELGINENTYRQPTPPQESNSASSHSYQPKAKTIDIELPEYRRYIALEIVRICFLMMAALVAIGWLVSVASVIIAIAATDEDTRGGVFAVGVFTVGIQLISGAVACLILIAASECLKVIMDIQSNTLATAHLAKNR